MPAGKKSAMLRKAVIALCIFLAPAPAHAISRYLSTSMTCQRVHALILQQGAVILQHKSTRTGNLLYDRYVVDPRFCSGGETTDWVSVPTKDTKSCPSAGVNRLSSGTTPGDGLRPHVRKLSSGRLRLVCGHLVAHAIRRSLISCSAQSNCPVSLETNWRDINRNR